MIVPARGWVIGVDFDNTIACYDDLMYTIALECGLIGAHIAKNKKTIRDTIRALPDGETHWRGVQVTAYGPRMQEARLIDGVREFFAECRRRSIPVYIVSHKTEYANFGEGNVNLRTAAMAWLDQHGFFDPDALGLSRASVFFEPTRGEKIERIKKLKATHFVDDLEETFQENAFPHDVLKILLTVHASAKAAHEGVAFSTWPQIHEHVLGGSELKVLSALLGKPVSSVARIGKGGNSKAYRVTCTDGTRHAGKFYFQRTMDGLDRLDVEFSSLRLLWENGVRCISEPLAVDRRRKIALYQYIDGTEIDSRTVSCADIEQVVEFAKRLNQFALSGIAEGLPRAAESCFSFDALHKNILGRLARLKTTQGKGASYAAMHRFLSEDFAPALDAIVRRARSKLGKGAWSAELPPSARTLSPSDFGFHNALRRPDGSLVFLDFEYFGQDDPAKMIADFVLHPAMELSETTKRVYVELMLKCFGADHGLADRLALCYPFFGLKWCMILLNEFVPKFLERREFAIDGNADRENVRARQLSKAQLMLEKLINETEVFPYMESAHE